MPKKDPLIPAREDAVRFLIVGASGFVGRNILAHVQSLGFEAVGTQARSREKGLVIFDLLKDRIADCVDPSFFQREGRVCVIISAVISDMDLCFKERETSRRVNVENTIQLIEDVCALEAKPVFLSSCFVFDGTVGYYTENHPISPANEYGRHKAEVERYIQSNAPNAFVARLDKIVGDNPREHHLLAQWYQRIAENQPIVCIEGGLLSPTYVKDVAQAIVLACQRKMTGVFHVTNSEFFNRDELARQFFRALGKTPNVIAKPLSEFKFLDKRGLKSYLDGSKFVRATGMRFASMREVFANFIRQLPV